jgi:hypothetical protein
MEDNAVHAEVRHRESDSLVSLMQLCIICKGLTWPIGVMRKIEQARRSFAARMSCSAIARQIGRSRNAVIAWIGVAGADGKRDDYLPGRNEHFAELRQCIVKRERKLDGCDAGNGHADNMALTSPQRNLVAA